MIAILIKYQSNGSCSFNITQPTPLEIANTQSEVANRKQAKLGEKRKRDDDEANTGTAQTINHSLPRKRRNVVEDTPHVQNEADLRGLFLK